VRKICKNCKYWKREGDYPVGRCKNKKFIYDSWDKLCPIDGLIYWDYEGYQAGFAVGERFGCIHFKAKEKK